MTMKHYEPKIFSIPELKGISAKTIEEHLKLYQGYVKNANLITDLADKLSAPPESQETYGYVLAELHRKFSFEYNGIKNHEYYFGQLEGGSSPLAEDLELGKQIVKQWGSIERLVNALKTIATTTRGIGWAILYYERDEQQLRTGWVDEQHLGHLNSAQFIFGIDMWEHSYVADYQPSGKKQYVEDYLANVNWKVAEKRFLEAQK